MNRVPVQPTLLRWARERAGYDADALTGRFPRLEEWERGDVQPTLKQVEAFAKATRTPVGIPFSREEPPIERVPIPDFRTVANVHVGHPSPDLLEIVFLCQQRQDWYRDFARSMHEPALDFVGSANLKDDIVEIGRDHAPYSQDSTSRSVVGSPPGPTRCGTSSGRRMRSASW